MADPRDLLRQLDALEKPKTSAADILRKLDQIEGRMQSETIYVAPNGGAVTRTPQGLSYRDDVWSTSNPQAIERIMAGEKPSDVSMSQFDQDTIARAPVTARLQEAVRGTPFVGSYIDELAGAVKGEGAQANSRALTSAMQRENPVETTALNVAGAVATTAPLAMAAGPTVAAAAPASRGGQALLAIPTGGILGAAEGAVYQAGEGGDPAQGAIIGGLVGAGAGLAAPYASAAVQRLGEWAQRTDVATVATALGVSRDAATVIRNAFRAGDMQSAKAALDAAGEQGMLADAGQSARELLDAAASAGGQAGTIAREAVEERAAGTSDRLNAALNDAFGEPLGAETAKRAIRGSTASTRKDLYSTAYAQPIDYAGSGGRYLESLLKRVPDSAIKNANDLMNIAGEESAQILARVADDGSVGFEKMPDVRQVHYILQGLDDAIEAATGQFGRGTTRSGKLKSLRSQIANTVKREVPEFAAAQDAAADSIRRESAIQSGYEALRAGTRRETLADTLRNASKAEKDALKQGVRSYIDDTLANVGRTITDANVDARESMKLVRDLSSKANRIKVSQILGREEADRLFAALEKETISLELRAAIATNSKTAIRQSIQGGVADQTAPGFLGTLMQGEPINATKTIVQALTGETSEAVQIRKMGIFEEIATALTNVQGRGAQRALGTIQKAIEGQPIKSAEAAQIAQVLTASGFLTGQSQASRRIQP